MRRIFRVFWDMAMVLIIVEAFAAILAIPLWWVITTFLWPAITYSGAFAVTSTLTVGICVVMWTVDLMRGVRI